MVMIRNIARLNLTRSAIANIQRNASTTTKLNEIFKVQVRINLNHWFKKQTGTVAVHSLNLNFVSPRMKKILIRASCRAKHQW